MGVLQTFPATNGRQMSLVSHPMFNVSLAYPILWSKNAAGMFLFLHGHWLLKNVGVAKNVSKKMSEEGVKWLLVKIGIPQQLKLVGYTVIYSVL